MESLIYGKEHEISEILNSPARESLDSWRNQFSPTQHEILGLMTEGRTHREIAELIEIDVAEVKHEVTAILRIRKHWHKCAGRIIS